MASNTTVRSFQTLIRRTGRACECSRPTPSRISSIRQFSASASRKSEEVQPAEVQPAEVKPVQTKRPRWSYTPTKMKAPFAVRLKDTEAQWVCNSDPERLDKFYIALLGRGGEDMLSEEVKWLAITHKSFDQGRRGFNDRLAFFGRRILNLQTNLAQLEAPPKVETQADPLDDRVPYFHPALDSLLNVTETPLGEILNKTRFATFATQMGMREILRWLPRKPDNLESSGVEAVLTTTIYAIVGAIALQRGGEIAAQIAREKILKPMNVIPRRA